MEKIMEEKEIRELLDGALKNYPINQENPDESVIALLGLVYMTTIAEGIVYQLVSMNGLLDKIHRSLDGIKQSINDNDLNKSVDELITTLYQLKD